MQNEDWRSSTAGTKVRAALWLRDVVGEHQVFTKSQLRAAFPDVEQIDRRVRDLRAEGWQILTYREDRSLAVDELRLSKIGGAVWANGYRSRLDGVLTSKQKAAIVAAAGYACAFCGAAAGEAYLDDPLHTARLSPRLIGRDRTNPSDYRALCDRCFSSAGSVVTSEQVQAALRQIDPAELAVLTSWLQADKRAPRAADVLWQHITRMPDAARSEIVQAAVEAAQRR